ncbi:MAG: hypothetical protein ABI900_11805 [Betaproteobacteria bacterium]
MNADYRLDSSSPMPETTVPKREANFDLETRREDDIRSLRSRASRIIFLKPTGPLAIDGSTDLCSELLPGIGATFG